jgi:hypothetical protein
LGAQADLTADGVRWLSPLPLWIGILAGPIAWAADLTVSYALVPWVCASRQISLLHLITLLSILAVAAGAWVSWLGFQHAREDLPGDGGRPRQRARFMAVIGLTSSALFLLAILAGEMPRLVLDACR